MNERGRARTGRVCDVEGVSVALSSSSRSRYLGEMTQPWARLRVLGATNNGHNPASHSPCRTTRTERRRRGQMPTLLKYAAPRLTERLLTAITGNEGARSGRTYRRGIGRPPRLAGEEDRGAAGTGREGREGHPGWCLHEREAVYPGPEQELVRQTLVQKRDSYERHGQQPRPPHVPL